ncbi:VOC family protein [Cellulosimicrobium arenosum]|uniref:VOC family protein n=1 Tax=Cellulosimicrobium arenosum TaxID=2708133 RepID=A0A927J0L3_9MICO|nr:VOC family protein [Cellulosimicrobium arenosum]MBD8079661.1 VOC family protein [Cellulosimicrobium arenosum]
MLTLSHTTVFVLDQDSAKAFYTDVLGFELRDDVSMGAEFEGAGAGFRWLTVGPQGDPSRTIVLSDCSMGRDAESAEQLRSLVAKGTMGAGVMETDDCEATYRELSAKGVTFRQPPVHRPYGVEAVFTDDSGNWFSLTERAAPVRG